jgi:hypothetical protein
MHDLQQSKQCLRVAVSGHRILTDTERVWKGVEHALDYLSGRSRTLEVFSSLAEGADRLVAEAVLRRAGTSLTVILPMAEEAYLADFGPDGSPSRLHYQALRARASRILAAEAYPERHEAYALAGRRVVDASDILLALWDGEPAQGRGGTAQVVEHARICGKEIIIVRTGNRNVQTGTAQSLGAEQGRVIIGNHVPARR